MDFQGGSRLKEENFQGDHGKIDSKSRGVKRIEMLQKPPKESISSTCGEHNFFSGKALKRLRKKI